MRIANMMLLCSLSIFIVACGPRVLDLRELNYLRKGLSIDSVGRLMSIQETGTFKIEHGRKYLLKSYPMFHEDVITGSSPGGSVGLVNMPSDRRVAFTLTTKVYLIFTDDRLRYWGLLEELQKSEDTEIQEIARYIFPY